MAVSEKKHDFVRTDYGNTGFWNPVSEKTAKITRIL